MDLSQAKNAVEAMLFAHAEPVEAHRLAEVLEMEPETVERLLVSLQQEYDAQKRGVCLLHLEERWQMATRNDYAACVKAILDKRRNTPLSQAAMVGIFIGSARKHCAVSTTSS